MSKMTLGIIGGGQLGSMLAVAAKNLNIKTVIFCDDPDAPAQKFSDEFINGSYNDENKINEFIKKVNVVTFEFETLLVAYIVTISLVLVSPSHEIALKVVVIFFFNNLFKISLDKLASVNT